MATVPLDPFPRDAVLIPHLVKAFPKVAILDRMVRRRLPAAAFPVPDPIRDSVLEILAVSYDGDAGGT